MQINLKAKTYSKKISKGDIIVMKKKDGIEHDYRANYLVIENVPSNSFTVLNMQGNNLMSSVHADDVSNILDEILKVFPQLEFEEVIAESDYQVVRSS